MTMVVVVALYWQHREHHCNDGDSIVSIDGDRCKTEIGVMTYVNTVSAVQQWWQQQWHRDHGDRGGSCKVEK